MIKATKVLGIIAVVIALVAAIGLTPTAVMAEKKPIKIGFIHTMSGPISMYGITSAAGAKIAVEEINAAGGVLGRKLELIVRDDKVNPEAGLREAKDLVLKEKVDFLAGTISSGVGMAISGYAKRAKKIYMINIAQSTRITEEKFNKYTFRFTTNGTPYFGKGPAIALAKTYKSKKIISLGYDYEAGKNALKEFKDTYLKMVPDAKIIDELWVPLGSTDFTAHIAKIANSGADAFYLASIYGGGELAFTKQAWSFGLYDKMKAVQPCAGDVETWGKVKQGDPYPKNALATCRYPFWAIKGEQNAKFVKQLREMTGLWPSYGSMDAYVIVYAIKAAVTKAGTTDTEKVIKAMETLKMDTFVGPVEMRAYDHQAMMPTWYGIMRFTPDLPFPHITDVGKLGAESYHTIDEIKKIRGE
ncbi:ABC transporter substrate-binding protein [Desulfoferula mesophila]|uniref:ABC transporter substrate-binding protein n=1 Tax=Desulfoferula mesophila TaxID=3058419 RepID=A0AAU9ESN6_9BACT|nr:ABC transporter substrate-binding protein [Desulfoferula mesophilus]